MFSSAQGTTEVEVIQLKRLFSATKSRLVRTQPNRPLHLSQWYEQMWKTRFTVHVPPRERALAQVQWPENLRPFHLKTCGREIYIVNLYWDHNLCIFYVIRWFEFVAFLQYFCAQQRLKGYGLSMTCNVQRKFPRPLLKKFYHHSYILSCIEETLGEGINFV